MSDDSDRCPTAVAQVSGEEAPPPTPQVPKYAIDADEVQRAFNQIVRSIQGLATQLQPLVDERAAMMAVLQQQAKALADLTSQPAPKRHGRR
jgi:hypothetical protein